MNHLTTRRQVFILCGLLSMAVLLWWIGGTRLTPSLESRLASDPRNAGFEATLSGRGGDITFNIKTVPSTFSRADVTRTLFLAGAVAQSEAAELDGQFYLAYMGQKKFQLPARVMLDIGAQWDKGENPLYLDGLLLPAVRRPDGSQPFPTPRGGSLYVGMEEVKQQTELHDEWWLNEMLKEYE